MSGIAFVVSVAVGVASLTAPPEVPVQRPQPIRVTPTAAPTPAAPPPASSTPEPPAPAPGGLVPEQGAPAPAAAPTSAPAEAVVAPDAPDAEQTEPGIEVPAHTSEGTESPDEPAEQELKVDAAALRANDAFKHPRGSKHAMVRDDAREITRARTMVAAGALAGVSSALLIIAAAVEGAKPDCDFGRSDCEDAPRKGLAAGMGVTGGLLAAGGAALLGVGIVRLRRLNAAVSADSRSAQLSIRGRF